MGRLREPVKALQRAHLTITTKVPAGHDPGGLFCGLEYRDIVSLTDSTRTKSWSEIAGDGLEVWLVTGIAHPEYLMDELKRRGIHPVWIRFNDHHHYTRRDIDSILKRVSQRQSKRKIILTTRKDATKLQRYRELQQHEVYIISPVLLFNTKNEATLISTLYDHIQ